MATETRVLTPAHALRPRFDAWLLVSVLALAGIGVIMVYSSSISDAFQYYGSPTFFLKRELVWMIAGLGALAFGAWLPYRNWLKFSGVFAGVSVLLLGAVLIPHIGSSSHGAQRWFQLGSSLSVEPSELAKIALILYMAHWLSRKGEKIRDFSRCSMPFGIMVGIVCLLILKQPDMGTAIVIVLSMLIVYFVAGARLDHLFLGASAAFLLALVALKFEAYRGARLAAWLDPWKYSHGAGYHTVQALLALGLGGLTGVGLGNSQQKYYLPAPYTDSIFAVSAEELGFLGAIAIIGLFVLFAYRGFRVARYAPDDFSRLLAVGITATIVIQAFINVAVITASLPFTGVPLPFISFGGSSLVISMLAVGILLNISSHDPQRRLAATESDTEAAPEHEAGNNGRQDGRARRSRSRGH